MKSKSSKRKLKHSRTKKPKSHSKRRSKKQSKNSKKRSKSLVKKCNKQLKKGHITYSPKKRKFILSQNISSHQRPIFFGNTLNPSLSKCNGLCSDM